MEKGPRLPDEYHIIHSTKTLTLTTHTICPVWNHISVLKYLKKFFPKTQLLIATAAASIICFVYVQTPETAFLFYTDSPL